MDKLIKHSLADWDFEPGHKYYIQDFIYISSPSALCLPYEDTPENWKYAFLKNTLAPNLKQGVIVQNFRSDNMIGASERFHLYFRCPEPLLHRATNGYRLRLVFNRWHLDRNDVNVANAYYTADLSHFTWYKMMLRFYTFLSSRLVLTLRIDFWIDYGAGYIHQFTHDDTDPLNEDSDTNRVGFSAYGGVYNEASGWGTCFFDDTEVWEPA